MKANRNLIKNEDAEVGVGTLIVFIAMVLVAAVAAAVLINTSGTLQQRAQSTGKEATQEVSSNLKLEAIYGVRDNTGGSLDNTIDNVTLHVGLSAGALPMDLSQLVIRYSDGSTVRELTYDADAAYGDATSNFNLTILRDSDSSFSWTAPVINSGDLVKITLYDVALSPRTDVQILMIPESGASVPADFATPSTYGTDQVHQFR